MFSQKGLKVLFAVLLVLGAAATLFYIFFAVRDRYSGSQTHPVCSAKDFANVRLSDNYLLKLHHLLNMSHKIFQESGILYCASSGTLLSIVRHGHLIPWDDDGDLIVYEPNFVAKRATVNSLVQKHQLDLNKPFHGLDFKVYKLRLAKNHPLNTQWPTEKQPFVDWLMFNTEQRPKIDDPKGKRLHSSSAHNRKLFPNDFVYYDELFPLRKVKLKCFSNKHMKKLNQQSGAQFNPECELMVPKNCEPTLCRQYGTKDDPFSWRKCYLASSHHSLFLAVKPCQLTPEQLTQL